jgi:deoxyribonuclease-4
MMAGRVALPPLGAHVSAAGGVHETPERAQAIGATAMQFFSKQASRWQEHLFDGEEAERFRGKLGATDVTVACVHDSYLINLASPDDLLRLRSLLSFITELKRCEALGVQFLVSHPGNYMDKRELGLMRNVECLATALECVPGNTVVLLETTAGSGTALGSNFGEMASMLSALPASLSSRVGVCVDTAHIFAAGHDLAGDFEGTWQHFADAIGWERLRMLHLNDSKAPLGSRRDRHELIGQGAIGELPFRRLMNDPRFADIPMVLETPKLGDATATDRRMLALLRSFLD